MAASRINARGSKRPSGPEIEINDAGPSSSSTIPSSDQRPSKKSRGQAERRLCPLCNKLVPLNMLAQHTEMELAKVNEVILDEASSEAGPSDHPTSSRRSAALRARASLTAMAPTRRNTNPNPIASAHDLEPPTPTSRSNRRTRSSLGAPADSMVERRRRRVGGLCPVCEEDVAEDLEEHVDRCLQDAVLPHREHSAARTESAREESPASPDREELVRATDFTDFRGTGFDIRDNNVLDVEDDLDIDGDEDTVLFGDSQFFESDIIARDEDDSGVRSQRGSSPASETNGHSMRTLRDLVAVRKMEMTIREVDIEGEEEDERVSVGSSTEAARVLSANSLAPNETEQDKDAHIASLMAKIEQLQSTIQQQASQTNTPVRATLHAKVKSVSATEDAAPTVCRICLDAFVEPVVSTGCWHLFCRECWLQSLGSTKYCPICKRITSTSNLRKVYL